MNLRLIEQQIKRREEKKQAEAIRVEQLKNAIAAAKKLSNMQHDKHRQWMVSTPTDYNAEYQAVFGNPTPTAYIHPISGEPIIRPTYTEAAVRGNTEEYNHLDVRWSTTTAPIPRRAIDNDVIRIRNAILNTPVDTTNAAARIPSPTYGSSRDNYNGFLRYYNNLISNTITNSIAVHRRATEYNMAMILSNIEGALLNLRNQEILASYSINYENNSIMIRWRYEIDPTEFMEQRVLR